MQIKHKAGYVWSIVCLLFYSNPLCVYAQGQELSVPAAASGEKEAVKFPVDLDFRDADIKDVARAFSRISQTNIIVSDDVKAKITLRVQAADWKEALNMVLGAYNITMLEKDKYLIITTVERRRQAEESGDLQTKVLSLNFVNVADVQKTLLSMLTSRGRIETDGRTNSLVITDILDRVNKIKEVALELDTRTPQVMIEAMILTVKLNDDEQMGVDWTITHKDRPERSLDQDLNLGKAGGLDLRYGKTIFPWGNLTSLLEYWKEQKRVNILATPRVLTLDNLTATIELTEQVPYTETTESTQSSSAISTTQFKDIPITLFVKPHITKDNYIFMNIKTEQSIHSGDVNNQPIIDSRKAETNVMVRDGETVVIGGLRKKEHTKTIDKLPLLGDIPYVGGLFRKTVATDVDTELVIFVTPHITTDTSLNEQDKKQLEAAVKMGEDQKAKKSRMYKSIPAKAIEAPKVPREEIKADESVQILKQAVPFPLRPPRDVK